MDVDTMLDTHLRQRPDLRGVIEKIRTMRDQITEVEDQQYQADKTSTLIAGVRQHAAQALADEWRALDVEAARRDAQRMDDRDADARERAANANGHGIDPMRFTRATTPAEISVLLNDAAAMDPDGVRKAWAYGQPRLREMAAREMREHKQPGATSAFNALVTWQSKMADVTRRAPDRTAMAETSSRRRRELREAVMAVCRLVALDSAVAKLLVAADVSERSPNGDAVKSTLTVGRWFDQFKSR